MRAPVSGWHFTTNASFSSGALSSSQLLSEPVEETKAQGEALLSTRAEVIGSRRFLCSCYTPHPLAVNRTQGYASETVDARDERLAAEEQAKETRTDR